MQINSILRRVLAAGFVAGSVATGSVAVAEPAAATTRYGCEYPRVCFYINSTDASNRRNPSAGYQDAGFWQTLGSRSRGAYAIFNSRNDDIALIRYEETGNQAFCVKPNEYVFLNPTEYPGAVTQLMISSRSTCP